MRVSFNPEALSEVEEATRWYRDNGGTIPSRTFVQELKRIVNLASGQPGVGPRHRRTGAWCPAITSHRQSRLLKQRDARAPEFSFLRSTFPAEVVILHVHIGIRVMT